MGRLRSLSQRIYGEPPPKGAPRSEMLRWVRGFYWKTWPLTLACYALVLLFSTTWLLVLAGVTALIWAQGLASISLRIRREERRDHG